MLKDSARHCTNTRLHLSGYTGSKATMLRFIGLWLGIVMMSTSVSGWIQLMDPVLMMQEDFSREAVERLFTERAKNQTTVLQRVLKLIPELRTQVVMRPGDPPLEDTLRHQYLVAFEEIEAGARELDRMRQSIDEDYNAFLKRKVQTGTRILKRVLNVSPELRNLVAPGVPPLEDTLLHQYLMELYALEAAIPPLIDY